MLSPRAQGRGPWKPTGGALGAVGPLPSQRSDYDALLPIEKNFFLFDVDHLGLPGGSAQ